MRTRRREAEPHLRPPHRRSLPAGSRRSRVVGARTTTSTSPTPSRATGCAARRVIEAVAVTDLTRVVLDLAHLEVTKVTIDGKAPAKYAAREQPAGRHPARDDQRRLVVPGRRSSTPAQPKPLVERHHGDAGWEELDRRRDRRGPAARCPDLVPLQRPARRQGVVPHLGHRASRLHRRQQRPAGVPPAPRQRARPGSTSRTSRWRPTSPPCRSGATTCASWTRRCRWSPPSRPTPARASRQAFGRQPEMMSAFEELFGPYPFASYAVVVTDDDLEIPLESQGLSTFGRNFLTDDWDGGPAGGPRARAPVVRQRCDPGGVARHLAARGLRLLRRVALVRGSPAAESADDLGAASPPAARPGSSRTWCSPTPVPS